MALKLVQNRNYNHIGRRIDDNAWSSRYYKFAIFVCEMSLVDHTTHKQNVDVKYNRWLISRNGARHQITAIVCVNEMLKL